MDCSGEVNISRAMHVVHSGAGMQMCLTQPHSSTISMTSKNSGHAGVGSNGHSSGHKHLYAGQHSSSGSSMNISLGQGQESV